MPTLISSFDKTKTLKGAWGRVDFTPQGAGLVQLSCKLFEPGSKLTTAALSQPDAGGMMHAVDDVPVEAEETMTAVDIEEIDAMLNLLVGLGGHLHGVATLYLRDPRDAAGTVRLQTNTFDCTVRRPDGPIRIGGADFSKTSLVFTSLSGAPITWLPDADAPDATGSSFSSEFSSEFN